MSSLDFGLFDWIDRGPGTTTELYEQRLQSIERADKAGFYGYHMAEHHGTALGMAPSPSVFFAAAMQRTEQIRFSPMAYLLPLYHPQRLIEEVCMLDHLSNGRFELGVSRGVSPYEIRGYGVEPDETRAIFDETLDIFRNAMTSDVLDHSGEHYQFSNVPQPLKPLQRPYPPLWYPSFSESGVDFAASEGLHYLCLGPPSLVTHLIARYREKHAEHAGDPNRINAHVTAPKFGAMRQIFIAETDAEAHAIARPAYDQWYASITELWHRHDDQSYDQFFAWEPCLDGETILIGSVDRVRDQIKQLVDDSGINYFVGSFAWGGLSGDDVARSMDLFIDEIMPAI